MEQVNISNIEEYQVQKVVKKVPILSDELMATVLFIDGVTKNLGLNGTATDRLYYIVKGSGKISHGTQEKSVREGSLFLVPRNEAVNFSTSSEHMVVLSMRSIKMAKRC